MNWIVWAFLGVTVLGLVALVCYAVWLWHKTSDLVSEIEMLGNRAGELGDLLDQIKMPEQFAAERAGK